MRNWKLIALIAAALAVGMNVPARATPDCAPSFAAIAAGELPEDLLHALMYDESNGARIKAKEFAESAKKNPAVTARVARLLINPEKYPNHRDELIGAFFYSPRKMENFPLLKGALEATLEKEASPGFLMSYYQRLEEYAGFPRFSDDAMRLRLAIEDRIRALQNHPDSAISADAKMRVETNFYRPRRSAEEERLLRQGLEATRAGTAQKVSSLDFTFGGQPVKLEVTEQRELERRVELPAMPFDVSVRWTDYRGSKNQYGTGVRIESSEDAVRVLLDRYHALAFADDTFRFRPLGSQHDHFHSGIVEQHTQTGDEGGKFTKSLANRITVNRRDGDNDARRYIVTHQKEVANYFDTAEGDLRKQKIALRVKEWHPVGETGDANAAPAKAIFIKRTHETAPNALFTDRDEIMVKLPRGASEEFQDAAIAALLKKEGIEVPGPVVPKVKIENERYGFDLMWKNDVKVGYVVVDSFTPMHANPGAKAADYVASQQWEVEILPQYQELVNTGKAELDELFRSMENTFQGRVDPRPKYQHEPVRRNGSTD